MEVSITDVFSILVTKSHQAVDVVTIRNVFTRKCVFNLHVRTYPQSLILAQKAESLDGLRQDVETINVVSLVCALHFTLSQHPLVVRCARPPRTARTDKSVVETSAARSCTTCPVRKLLIVVTDSSVMLESVSRTVYLVTRLEIV